MIIGIAAFILLALFAGLGYLLGLVRALVMILGVVLGGVLALPLGPQLRGIFPSIGVTNPVWLWIWPPVLAFFLVLIVTLVGALFADIPIVKYFKYRADEVQRVRWARMSKRTGAFIGALGGLLCTLWLGAGIYGIGYLTVPFANEESDPAWLRYFNQARKDMASLGMDRTVESLDPMPKKYYPVVDMLSFLYWNNPAVVNRLASYPPFLTYGERQEFKDLAGDKDYWDLLQKHPGLVDLMNNPRTLTFVNNPDLWQELGKIDLEDLRHYLETGKSLKYDPLKILGRWDLDVDEVLLRMKKKKPDITKSELDEIRAILGTMSAGTTLLATTDNKVVLDIKGNVIDMAALAQLRAAAPPPGAGGGMIAQPRRGGLGAGGVYGIPGMMRQNPRYANPNLAAPPPAAPPAAPATPAQVPLKVQTKTYQGTWDGEGDNYQLVLQGQGGGSQTVDASVDGDQLVFKAFGREFVFVHE